MSCLAKRIASLSSHSELRSSIRSGPNSSASSAVEKCHCVSFCVPLANITTISWPPLPFKYSNTRNLWCRALPYQVPSLDQPMIGSPTVVTESNSTRAMTSATSTTLSNVNRWVAGPVFPRNSLGDCALSSAAQPTAAIATAETITQRIPTNLFIFWPHNRTGRSVPTPLPPSLTR